MKMKKILFGATAILVGTTLLSACGGNSEDSAANDEKTNITFWAAPNPTQLKYWQEMADEFEKQNEDITVEVTQMKESPSSEATIQSAIASNTAPTLSENINRSFAAQLAASEAILPLEQQASFDTILEDRNMKQTIDSWKFSDDSQYVLPVYSNPILFGWRLDILNELGINEVPKTYTELLQVVDKVKDTDKALWAKKDLTDPTAWMRWFDFFPLYNAASEGAGFVENNKFSADETAMNNVFELMSTLADENVLRTGEATDPFENGDSIMTDLGPWTFPNWEEKYPELKFGENYTVTAPVVPDALADTEHVSTYADAKGIVMYAQATEEEQAAAMKFLSFVYSDGNNDMKLLEMTSLIPARDDATENDTFKAYFEENPAMKVYAENVPYAVPAMDNEKYNDIQQVFGEQAWVPVVRGEKDAKTAVTDARTAVEGALQ
ncbi:ABC transporter substrate-binding protein [Enterococcus casseliflavus]|uniref:ABC transporter substrate-binding protein n=1 Tax=Enterococcus casseliflavus TaxID=37734 RepID=UPI00232F7BF7|nr:ABC transporter substrate-binding protein [Enterococcus casseliflavus]MDB1693669.1 ABC transporter substrate-binding protein [Enterococcus casseliflavus]MDB1697561.1 ABC transporter substrate-binding protein [Enterococcus casseliflavus]MDB1701038.1 ABC transporter substrate-binding protein [Enterococcus casseliflavus]MDB1705235.1 ABC transporter substrate-binding protein [Enterococcus casseliflavus]